MARRRIAFIQNPTTRRATFSKRMSSLFKKMSELTTLCGVDACAVIYTPYSDQPLVWPPSHEKVTELLTEFQSLPRIIQRKSQSTTESLLQQRISKGKEKLEKLRKDNRKKEIEEVMFQCLNGTADVSYMSMLDLNDLAWMADDYQKKIKFLLGKCGSEPDALPFVNGEAEDVGSSNKGEAEELDPENQDKAEEHD